MNRIRETACLLSLGLFLCCPLSAAPPGSAVTEEVSDWSAAVQGVLSFPRGPWDARIEGPGRVAVPGKYASSKFRPLIAERGIEIYEEAYGAEERAAATDWRAAERLLPALRERAAAIRNDPEMKRYVLLRAFGLARLMGERPVVLRRMANAALPLLGRKTAAELAQRVELLTALADETVKRWQPEDEELPVVSAGEAADAMIELAAWQIDNGFSIEGSGTMGRADRFARRALETGARLDRLARLRARAAARALAPGNPATRPTVGAAAPGTADGRVVVVFDASGSVIAQFADVQRLAIQLVDALAEQQSFAVILFQEDGAGAPASFALPATARNKDRAGAFIRAARPQGSSDPRAALEAAFNLGPDVIWLLSDGDFPDNRGLLAYLRERNRRRNVVVHVVGVIERGDDASEVLRAVASENGGDFRYASDALAASTRPAGGTRPSK